MNLKIKYMTFVFTTSRFACTDRSRYLRNESWTNVTHTHTHTHTPWDFLAGFHKL